jgi:hypothetical protein
MARLKVTARNEITALELNKMVPPVGLEPTLEGF